MRGAQKNGPRFGSRLVSCRERRDDLVDVSVHFHTAPFLFDIAVLVDEERRTDNAVVLFPVILLQLPDAV